MDRTVKLTADKVMASVIMLQWNLSLLQSELRVLKESTFSRLLFPAPQVWMCFRSKVFFFKDIPTNLKLEEVCQFLIAKYKAEIR